MTTPLQLLFASAADGDVGQGQVTAAPITVTMDGVNRPQAVDRDGTHFVALTLGAQDLIGLAAEMGRSSDFYPVEVDVRDWLMHDPEDAEAIEETLLGYLRLGERERVLNFVTAPGGILMWAIGLSSPSIAGKVTISRDGTLQTTPPGQDQGLVEVVLRALHDVLADDT